MRIAIDSICRNEVRHRRTNHVSKTITAPANLAGVASGAVVNQVRRKLESTENVNQRGKRIQALVERVDRAADAEARELLQECLHSLLALYGDGLARVMQLVARAGVEGEKLRETLLRDKLVSGLLLIHGLHPISLEARLRGALEQIRPYLQSHGGNVELISLKNDIATLQLQGTCRSCPSSSATLELAVRQVIEEACPDLAGFEVKGVTPQFSPPAPGPCLATP